ncbi:MAG TPA: DUF1232 domain-containing protein [Fimbriimonadaceae bacterium]|nr:DUF1232 domain-containing protein [Fimbriimonadaceae bacterium]HRJ32245.1 DUF1232 domain-containing protein [Fimbriimonadaceae bacterium]
MRKWFLLRSLRQTGRHLLDSRVPAGLKILPMLAAGYLVFPVDFVPDIFPLLGITDDIAFFALMVTIFNTMASAALRKSPEPVAVLDSSPSLPSSPYSSRP